MSQVELGASALPGIVAAAVASTFVLMLIIRRFSDQTALARTKAQAIAHLLECRLFREDPAQVLRSQRELLLDNLRLLYLLLPALVVSAIPMAAVLWGLDGLYSRAPLPIGRPAVVLAHTAPTSIRVPPAFAVETRPVFAQATGDTAWRIRPLRESSGQIQIDGLTATIAAGEGPEWLPQTSLAGSSAITVRYPRATVLSFSWVFWFAIISLASALLFRRILRLAL